MKKAIFFIAMVLALSTQTVTTFAQGEFQWNNEQTAIPVLPSECLQYVNFGTKLPQEGSKVLQEATVVLRPDGQYVGVVFHYPQDRQAWLKALVEKGYKSAFSTKVSGKLIYGTLMPKALKGALIPLDLSGSKPQTKGVPAEYQQEPVPIIGAGVALTVNPNSRATASAKLRPDGPNGTAPLLPLGYINISVYSTNAAYQPQTGKNGYLSMFIFGVDIAGKATTCTDENGKTITDEFGNSRTGIWVVARILWPGEEAVPGEIGRSFDSSPTSPGAVVKGFYWDGKTPLVRYPTHAEAAAAAQK